MSCSLFAVGYSLIPRPPEADIRLRRRKARMSVPHCSSLIARHLSKKIPRPSATPFKRGKARTPVTVRSSLVTHHLSKKIPRPPEADTLPKQVRDRLLRPAQDKPLKGESPALRAPPLKGGRRVRPFFFTCPSLWAVDYGLWSVVCGLWSVVCGLWSVVF